VLGTGCILVKKMVELKNRYSGALIKRVGNEGNTHFWLDIIG
jgi:hypothetical protein